MRKANFKIKEARAEKGYTQSQVAEMLGLSIFGYQRKENGVGYFTEAEIKKISEILEKEITEIFFN